ncbi:hypothetical protein HLB23_21105 [Nocardia uniformis]|uniref:Uncharacterized protein n=1 Tax=Nocardia uniformis TaxID=53432 RepID=A0A849C401_9NOCA|nr:hypothetical protein [Nocardia uniformis]NNH72326.1 hypothetical protein [Nocardia uniformis]
MTYEDWQAEQNWSIIDPPRWAENAPPDSDAKPEYNAAIEYEDWQDERTRGSISAPPW